MGFLSDSLLNSLMGGENRINTDNIFECHVLQFMIFLKRYFGFHFNESCNLKNHVSLPLWQISYGTLQEITDCHRKILNLA